VTTPQQAVDAITNIFGRYAGCRPAHAKGTICTGRFTPTPEAAELTRAPHMQGGATDVTVRFSNNAGDPARPDTSRQARGMATRFHLDGDSHMDIVAISLSRFSSRTPDSFVALNRLASRSGGPLKKLVNRARLVVFLTRHREAVRTTLEMTILAPRIASYANCRYNALHSFKWIDAGGRERYVRYSWLPEEGERSLSRLQARRLDPDFLQQQLHARLGRRPPRPVRFRLQLQLASVEDMAANRVLDPTKVWPGEQAVIVTAGAGDRHNRFVTVGVLELDSIWNGKRSGAGLRPFDVVPAVDGIEPSDDPTLRFRPAAYELSFQIRTGRAKAGDA
jgi:catalase